MRKSVWWLLGIGLVGVSFLGLGGMVFLRRTPGVEGALALKEKLESVYRPDEAVVALDRDLPGKHGLVVKLAWEEPPWGDLDEARSKAKKVGEDVWRHYAPPEGRTLEKVTVVFRVDEGWGCSGPREVCRLEVANPRVRDPEGGDRGSAGGRRP